MWMILTASALLGLVAGRSIVAEAASHRNDRPDEWLSPACDICGEQLTITMHRCRDHGHRQPWSNSVVPIATALIFAGFTAVSPTLWTVPAFLVFAGALVLLTVTDIDTKLIPNRILFPSTLLAVGLLAGGGVIDGDMEALVRAGLGGLAYFVGMYVLALIARGGLGFGDVKLAFLIGVFTAYLSWGHLVVAAIGSFIIGGLVAVVLLVSHRAGRKDAIPFGPFMTSAAIIAVVAGDAIVSWYVR